LDRNGFKRSESGTRTKRIHFCPFQSIFVCWVKRICNLPTRSAKTFLISQTEQIPRTRRCFFTSTWDIPTRCSTSTSVPGRQLITSRPFRIARDRTRESLVDLHLFLSLHFPSRAMSSDRCTLALLFGLLTFLPPRETQCATNVTDVAEQVQAENALAKLVKMFSKPGAFKRVSREDHLELGFYEFISRLLSWNYYHYLIIIIIII